MEALIIAIAALALLVLIDAGYWIAISLVRWAPVIAAGALAFWIAQQQGAESLDALGIGCLASVAARPFLRPRYISDDNGLL